MKITKAKLYKQLSTESRELKSSFLKCIYYGGGHLCGKAEVWSSENNVRWFVCSFHGVALEGRTQVFSLGHSYFYYLSHLSGPKRIF